MAHVGSTRPGSESDDSSLAVSEGDAKEAMLFVPEANLCQTMATIWGVGLGLEIGMLLVAFAVFPMGPYHAYLVANFVFFLVARIATSIPCMREGGYHRDENNKIDDDLMAFRMMLFLVPFMVYLPVIVSMYVHHCNYEVHTKELKAKEIVATVAGAGGFMNATAVIFNTHSVDCASSWSFIPYAGRGIALVKAAGQAGVPALFGFMFIKLGKEAWGIDFKDNNTRHNLLLCMLDLMDCSTFVTMAFYPSAFIFFQHNKDWRRGVEFMFVLGYFCTLIRTMLVSRKTTVGRMSIRTVENPDPPCFLHRLPALLSLVCNDLPFLCVRLYFNQYVGLTVNTALLGKNVVCAINSLAVLVAGPDNPVSKQLIVVLMLMPGGAKIQKKAAQEVYERLKLDLDEAERQEAALEIIKWMMANYGAPKSAIRFFIDTPFVNTKSERTALLEQCLHHFDFTEPKGELDQSELEGIFSLIHSEDIVDTLDLKEFRKDKSITIEKFATEFVQHFPGN